MRGAVEVLVAIGFCVLGYGLYSQSVELKNLRRDLDKSTGTTKQDSAASGSLDLQGKCARQALWAFTNAGWKREAQTDFVDHYSPALNRCFMEIEQSGGKVPSNSKMVVDAFEQRTYANYYWVNLQGKKFWEVKPIECSVTLPSGEEKQCDSEGEFDELVKPYMR